MGIMHLVRLVCLGVSSAIKAGIIVKDTIRDRVTFKISVRLRFELVRVRVSYVILHKNKRRTGVMSFTFRAGIVRF